MTATQTPVSVSEITAAVLALPTEAQREVLHFAQFLQARLAEQVWDDALEATTPEQVAKIRARIASQRAQTTPLFNDSGALAPPTSA